MSQRMSKLRDVMALLVCNSDRRERMAKLLVCITLVVVSGHEHSTFELKHFPFLVAYTCLVVQLAITLAQCDPGLQPDHPKQCRQVFVTYLRTYC